MPGLMITAPASGSGKTTVMLGLLRLLHRQGIPVQPLKNGPDYLDTVFHRIAIGGETHSFNLDGWAMSPAQLASNIPANPPFLLVEGSMGLFDGVRKDGAFSHGSSASVAQYLDVPIVLVQDVRGQAQSAAMVAVGCREMTKGLKFGGVILNNVSSDRHEALIRQAFEHHNIPILGVIRRKTSLTLPSRHLGLSLPEEDADILPILDGLADLMAESLDVSALLALAYRADTRLPPREAFGVPPAQRIAMAKDQAFCFTYAHLMDEWRRLGAEIIPFSPLNDEGPDEVADFCWLPGGYPELFAAQLSGNKQFQSKTKAFAAKKPVHGECGGYMTLGRAIIDRDGKTWPMLGLLGLVTSFAQRRLHLGYRTAKLRMLVLSWPRHSLLRGHEFHYSTIVKQPDQPMADITDADDNPVKETGSVKGKVSGSFFHFLAQAGQI